MFVYSLLQSVKYFSFCCFMFFIVASFGCLPGKTCLCSDLLCVEWDVRLYFWYFSIFINIVIYIVTIVTVRVKRFVQQVLCSTDRSSVYWTSAQISAPISHDCCTTSFHSKWTHSQVFPHVQRLCKLFYIPLKFAFVVIFCLSLVYWCSTFCGSNKTVHLFEK